MLQGSETCFLLSWGSTPAAERMLHEECLVTKHSTVPGRKMKSWSKQKLNRVKGEAYVGNQPGPQLIIQVFFLQSVAVPTCYINDWVHPRICWLSGDARPIDVNLAATTSKQMHLTFFCTEIIPLFLIPVNFYFFCLMRFICTPCPPLDVCSLTSNVENIALVEFRSGSCPVCFLQWPVSQKNSYCSFDSHVWPL